MTATDRIRFGVGIRALGRVLRDPDDTEAGVQVVLAFAGSTQERLYQRVRRDGCGARILRERPPVRARLRDARYLSSLPPGSLGREYLAWMGPEGLSADALSEADVRARDLSVALDDERRFLRDYITDLHDLWHVVTGYGRDYVGEVALAIFSWVQTGNRGLIVTVPLSYVALEYYQRGTRRVFRDAFRRSKAATWLPVQDWLAFVEQPLLDVRRELGLGPPPIYRPVSNRSRHDASVSDASERY